MKKVELPVKVDIRKTESLAVDEAYKLHTDLLQV